MKLSHLQKHILLAGYGEKNKFGRGWLLKFYEKSFSTPPLRKGRTPKKRVPKKEDQVNIITKSLERLIDKGFLVGFGVRTPKKWFIKEIKLTSAGRRVARGLQGEQQALPFKVKSLKFKV
jgi:hypothetical protein